LWNLEKQKSIKTFEYVHKKVAYIVKASENKFITGYEN